MNTLHNIKKLRALVKDRHWVVLFAVLSLIYLGLSFLIPPTHETLVQYHISSARARLLTVTVVVPLVIIWAIGLFGSLRVKSYSRLVRTSAEGNSLNTISNGLLVLVISQPVNSNLTSIVNLVGRHLINSLPTLTIVNNYIQIILVATGLTVVAGGASQLANLTKKRINDAREQQVWVASFIVFSILYSYFLTKHPIHNNAGPRPYYMPDWLILLTIAIPYLFFWYRGLYASFCIYNYQKNVKGLVYKGSLIYVAAGIVAVILSSVFIRVLATISYTLSRLSLGPVLIIIYAFLILSAAGYLMIAWGAKKLRKIEEV